MAICMIARASDNVTIQEVPNHSLLLLSQQAIKFVFGSSFVCSDLRVGEKVTFDPHIRVKSVSIDGDVADPSGVGA